MLLCSLSPCGNWNGCFKKKNIRIKGNLLRKKKLLVLSFLRTCMLSGYWNKNIITTPVTHEVDIVRHLAHILKNLRNSICLRFSRPPTLFVQSISLFLFQTLLLQLPWQNGCIKKIIKIIKIVHHKNIIINIGEQVVYNITFKSCIFII